MEGSRERSDFKRDKKSWVAEVDGARIALFSGDKTYLCYVRLALEYAAPVWHGSILENDAIKLKRIQCSVALSLLQAERNTISTPKETLLRSLNWPSSRWRREIRAVLLFFYLPKLRPAPLYECLYPFAYSKSHRSFRKPYQFLLLPYANSKILSSPFL